MFLVSITPCIIILILASLSSQNEASVAVLETLSRNKRTISVNERSRSLRGEDNFDRQLDTLDQNNFTRLLSEDNDEDEDGHEGHGHEDPHDEGEHKKPYGTVLLATFLVNIITLVGIFAFIPLGIKNKGNCFNAAFWATVDPEEEVKEGQKKAVADPEEGVKEEEKKAVTDPEQEFKDQPKREAVTLLLDIFVPSFACGALLATAFFLVIPESIAFIQNAVIKNQDEEAHEEHEGHEEEGMEILPGTIVRFATSILAGYMLPLILGAIFPKPSENDNSSKLRIISNLRLAGSILIGDAAHNFCDGIFIGVAFMTCSKSIAWSIVGVTIYHEVAQEVADFFLLTKHAGLSVGRALLLNFAAGLSVVVGGLMILGLNINDMAIGVILAFSGGVYTYIAASECLPRVDSVVTNGKDRLYSILFFLLGAIPIGLTLLNHEHCE
mmetsp:Transcript_37631/g.44864  ORF Transcript_37631/g.44864 Transcript_37631/m.44864 type:complete len:440 (-) Transcript_37631:278-1597(-)|eukprot:CAMPEP_0198254156 /NCGR_PEP_ID=MMETSP1447-20131203/4525_1 /TAXON_ID=420782 /ORGANISM="Chaetoceros dichaeta, Strain CCMP1751" /LENGTH=439 /DNA_ID=CAMNT_0043940119 /DNA_START=63 /DNA_END=1382 /DNA_ORIENTATION=+